MLIVMSLVFPVLQLVILGHAFGGNVKHLKVAVVDQDRGLPAVRVRELAAAAASGARTFDPIEYGDSGSAMDDLRNGRVNGVLTIPPDFSRRVLARNQPRVALIEDNTDSFVSASLAATVGSLIGSYKSGQPTTSRIPGRWSRPSPRRRRPHSPSRAPKAATCSPTWSCAWLKSSRSTRP